MLTRKTDPQLRTQQARGQWMSHAPGGARETGRQPSAARFSGTLDDLAVADLIQIVQLLGKSAQITVTRNGAESHLWCSDGELIDAQSGSASGEAALFRILSFEQGWLVAELQRVERTRTIFGTSQQLLLEAARRKDELVRRGAPSEPLDSAPDTARVAPEPVRAAPAELAAAELAEVAQQAAALPPIVAQPHRPERGASRGFAWLGLASLLLLPGAYFLGARTAPVPEPAAQQVVAPLVAAPKPESYEVAVSAEPATAELWLDGKLVATGQLKTSALRDGASHELNVQAPGFTPVTIFFADAAPPAVVRLERLPAARTPAADALSAAVRGALSTPTKGGVPAPREGTAPAAPAPAPARPPAGHGKASPRNRNEPHVRVIGEEEPVVRVLD